MKKFFSAVFLAALLLSSCTKKTINPGTADTESPVIKIISPLAIPNLRAGEYLNIKAIITDNVMLHTIAWEAVNAAGVCGNNPYKGEYSPGELVHEMNIKFLVPAQFSGDRTIRVYAMDNSGNYTSTDVGYVAEN